MAQPRFLLLLVTLVLVIVVSPFEAQLGRWAVLSSSVLFWLVLASAVAAIRGRRTVQIALPLCALAVLVQGVNLAVHQPVLAMVGNVLAIVFMIYIIAVILNFIFHTQRVTVNVIYASLCIYLLLAVAWAVLYSLIEYVDPGSFVATQLDHEELVQFQFTSKRTNFAFYYSLVTMTTLGYGDVLPVKPAAQTFAALQAATGQIYLAVLVARLVGLHIVHSNEAGKNK